MAFGMVLGTTAFALIHSAISLVGIASGLVVVFGFFTANRLPVWNAIFLVTTVLTSASGFGFPFFGLLPSHKVGIISLVVLAIAIYALYVRHLVGAWRGIYVVGAVLALYLNIFVLVVRLFRGVAFLNALAPTQVEPPFAIVQGVVLLVFVAVGVLSVKKFKIA